MNAWIIGALLFLAFFIVPRLYKPKYEKRDPAMAPNITEISSLAQYDQIKKELGANQLMVIG